MKKHVIDIYAKSANRYDNLVADHFDEIWDSIISTISIPQNSYILDLGCGTGATIHKIARRYKGHALHLAGVDLSREMINEAQKKYQKDTNNHQIDFKVQDCFQYLKTCDSEKYDIVIVSLLLAYVKTEKLFSLIYRTLKRGGKFILLSTPREPFCKLEKELYRFALSHLSYINWWKLLTEKISLAPTTEKIVKILNKNKFSNIKKMHYTIKIHFENPVLCLEWMDKSGWGTKVFNWVKKGKKEFLINEFVSWMEDKKLKILGEPIKAKKPFTFNWPIVGVIAQK